MSAVDAPRSLVSPTALSALSPGERVEAAARVRQMCDTEAWADFRRGVAGKQAGFAAFLMGMPVDRDTAIAKVIGEMAGVGLIDTIATQVIEDGEKAAQEIREREEGS